MTGRRCVCPLGCGHRLEDTHSSGGRARGLQRAGLGCCACAWSGGEDVGLPVGGRATLGSSSAQPEQPRPRAPFLSLVWESRVPAWAEAIPNLDVLSHSPSFPSGAHTQSAKGVSPWTVFGRPWAVGLACGPREQAQPGAVGCWRRGQLPLGPGVLALLCRSELLGPTLVKPPGLCPLAAAGPGPSGGDDAACSGRVLVPTSGQHPEPRSVLAPPSEHQPGTAGCRWQQQGA